MICPFEASILKNPDPEPPLSMLYVSVPKGAWGGRGYDIMEKKTEKGNDERVEIVLENALFS